MDIARVTDMAEIVPLFAGWPENLARSTLDGCMGRAYSNGARSAAQIVNGDFAMLAGDAHCAEASELAANIPEDFAASQIVIAAHEEAWHPVIERAFGGRATLAERYAIRKDVHHFDERNLRRLTGTLPEGIRLCPLDGSLYRKALAESWSRDLVNQFADETDYAARGLGFMALRGDEPLAGASSYVVFHGGLEIEIDTRTDMRRQGLAAACGAALVLGCLERGLYPSWDAANRASVALAEKLGYVFDHAYPVYEVSVLR